MTATPATISPVRMLIGILGLDQHETGALVVSRAMMEAGIEVIYLGRFHTPESVARAAITEDADVVGISCHSWEFLDFVDDLVARLREAQVPLIIGGSVLTEGDARALKAKGVADVFGAGSSFDAMATRITEIGHQRRRAETGASR